MRLLRAFAIAGIVALLLVGCSDESEIEIDEAQKFLFLESLKQVETGGSMLQMASGDQVIIGKGLAVIDEGLRLAFQVRRDFLDQFDLRLGKSYERLFIQGIETYRLGLEAADLQQQQDGLQRLQQWAAFWQEVEPAVMAKLHPQ